MPTFAVVGNDLHNIPALRWCPAFFNKHIQSNTHNHNGPLGALATGVQNWPGVHMEGVRRPRMFIVMYQGGDQSCEDLQIAEPHLFIRPCEKIIIIRSTAVYISAQKKSRTDQIIRKKEKNTCETRRKISRIKVISCDLILAITWWYVTSNAGRRE